MNLDKFTGSGSTPSRRAFWDKVTDAVLSSQKQEGRNVSVDEHQGLGTVINFPDQTPSAPPPIVVTPVYCAEMWGCRSWQLSFPDDCEPSGSPLIGSEIAERCTTSCPVTYTSSTQLFIHAEGDVSTWKWSSLIETPPHRESFSGSNTPPPPDTPAPLPQPPFIGTQKHVEPPGCGMECPDDGGRYTAYIASIKLIFKLFDPSGTATARWRVRYYGQTTDPFAGSGWTDPVLLSEVDYEQDFSVPTEDYDPEDCFDERLCVTDLVPYMEPPEPDTECDGDSATEVIYTQIAAP